MKTRSGLALLLVAAIAGLAAGPTSAASATPKLPYVYTSWKQFTVADGLPNDHVFAVKADGPRVWVGTEDGLALIDKASARSCGPGRRRTACPSRS